MDRSHGGQGGAGAGSSSSSRKRSRSQIRTSSSSSSDDSSSGGRQPTFAEVEKLHKALADIGEKMVNLSDAVKTIVENVPFFTDTVATLNVEMEQLHKEFVRLRHEIANFI